MGLDANIVRTAKINYPIVINNKDELEDIIYKGSNKDLGYWRYGTAIHKFFETKLGREIGNCEYVLIKKEWLEELLQKCRDITNRCVLVSTTLTMNDVDFCKKTLPTPDTKFNKNYCQYDTHYNNIIYNTKYLLESIMEDVDFETYDVYYEADW